MATECAVHRSVESVAPPAGRWLLAIGLLLVNACGAGSAGPNTNVDVCAAARAIRATIPGGTAGFLTQDKEADITARVIPGGFGGLFEDLPSHRLVARIKDLAQQSAATDSLSRVLFCGAAYPGWLNVLISLDVVEIRQGQYSATELLSYLVALETLRTDQAVWAMEIDPEANRIWIGLRSASELSRIQQAVAARSVPSGALTIEVPPPTTGAESFEIVESTIQVTETIGGLGVFSFPMHARFTNRFSETRYPDQCEDPSPRVYFGYVLMKWDGSQWIQTFEPICRAVHLAPRPVAPGQQQTDSILVVASRRLNAQPFWLSARVTGTYRLEGRVYKSTTPSPPFVTDLAPLEERVSAPFRLIRSNTGAGASSLRKP